MNSYFHSVTLDRDKCVGCTNCIKRCPTEAIRVHEGKAKIINERCIDCGECIRVCPQHAKLAITDTLEMIREFKYPIALPAPTLYGQFKSIITVDQIISGLLELGFFRVWEVAAAAERVTQATNLFLRENLLPQPVISSACPAVVKLIKVRYPELVDNILPLDSPMEVAARLAKEEMAREGYPEKDVGVFFISPCAAKFTSVKNPIGRDNSYVDGVLAIKDIYGPLRSQILNLKYETGRQLSGGAGIGWAITGGEGNHVSGRRSLAVDGLYNVARVLEDVVVGKLKDVDFIEGLACMGGCVGGPLTVENPFMAKSRIASLAAFCHSQPPEYENLDWKEYNWTGKISPQSIMRLDDNMVLAMKKMEELEQIHKALPGLDCGSCGAPTCHALAEDIVRGQADEIDCVFKLREKVAEMAANMVQLSSKLPPSIGKKE